MPRNQSPYEVLGLQPDCSKEEAKKVFRKLSKEWHPDKHNNSPESTAKFQEIAAAYQAIESGQADRGRFTGHHNPAAGFDPWDIFSNFSQHGHIDFGEPPQESSSLFGKVRLTFAESALGASKNISISGQAPCNGCSGIGAKKGDFSTCSACRGTGQNTVKQGFFIMSAGACSACSGRGINITKPCDDCKGVGSTYISATTDVQIPPCIESNTILLFNYQNTQGRLHVEVEPDAHMTRAGIDILSDVHIELRDALLGCKIDVPTIHGDKSVDIKSCIAFNSKLRLRGLGCKIGKNYGNHVVSFKIKPANLSDEQMEKIKAAFDDETIKT